MQTPFRAATHPARSPALWAGAAVAAILIAGQSVMAQPPIPTQPARVKPVPPTVLVKPAPPTPQPDPKPAPPMETRPSLVVHAFADAGGLPTVGGDKNTATLFSDGLRSYLAEVGKDRFVTDTTADDTPPKTGRVLHLGGEISRTSDKEDGGPFLVVARLYEEKTAATPRKIVAQWAGVADNYRFLTGNLEKRPDVDKEGLLGELGKRVSLSVAPMPATPAWSAPLAKAAQTGRVIASIVPVGADGKPDASAPVIAAPVLKSEQTYRLKVAAKNGGTVYVVRVEGGRLVPVLLPKANDTAAPTVEPGKPILLPSGAGATMTAPKTDKAMEQTFLVLVRHADTKPVPPAPPKQAEAQTGPALRLAAFAPSVALPAADEPNAPVPVRILSTSGDAVLPEGDGPEISRLVKMLTADPNGTWSAHRLIVRIVPAKS